MPHDLVREGLEQGWDIEPLATELADSVRAYMRELEGQPFALVKVSDVMRRLSRIVGAM